MVYISIFSFLLAIWALLGIRPILTIKLDWVKMCSPPKQDAYKSQFILGATVINTGVLPIKYRLRNRSESLRKAYPDGYYVNIYPLVDKKINNQPFNFNQIGVFNERVNSAPVSSKNGTYPFYDHIFALGSGESTSEGNHVIGVIAIDENKIDYESLLNSYMWESYVEIEPCGFWGLPIIKKLNTPKSTFTNINIVVRAIDRL